MGRVEAPRRPRRLERHATALPSIYGADRPADVQPQAARALDRVYVPNSESDTVDVIDPATYRVVGHFAVGALPQHVSPAWDLRRLYVDDDVGNTLTPIDPRTGRPGRPIPVADPYNLYFTPDGVDTRSGRLLARIDVGESPDGLCVWPQPGRYSLGHTGNLR
jgi:YVTN family beta-propeller protein